MKIALTSVLVDDQEKALAFYTEVLGFVRNREVPLGGFKWLTVISPEVPTGVELLLEPNAHPAARTFQAAMYADGIPLASFAVDDVDAEFRRLRERGVTFRQEPKSTGPVRTAVFADGCGNWIQIAQS